MVIVTVTRDVKGKIVQFEATGHADFAKLGEDIVCAAVSSLLQTTLLGLQEYLKINLEINKEKGNLKVRIKEIPQQSLQIEACLVATEAILETMVLGLKAIEKEYKEYMKLITVQVDRL
ncbi:MAG: ribosomal-processing cysteine protease Prp [Nitrospirota bacterium]